MNFLIYNIREHFSTGTKITKCEGVLGNVRIRMLQLSKIILARNKVPGQLLHYSISHICNSFFPFSFSLYFLTCSKVSESAAASGAEEDGNCTDCKLAPPDGEFVHCANCERAPRNEKSVQCAKCQTAPPDGEFVHCAKCKTAPPNGKPGHCMKCDKRKRRQAVPDNKAPAVLYLPLGKMVKRNR